MRTSPTRKTGHGSSGERGRTPLWYLTRRGLAEKLEIQRGGDRDAHPGPGSRGEARVTWLAPSALKRWGAFSEGGGRETMTSSAPSEGFLLLGGEEVAPS